MSNAATLGLSETTQLIAAHGVFALTAIFIFYQQRRTYSDLRESDEKARPFLKKVYVSAIAATYVLCGLSILIWSYNTFFFSPRVYLAGVTEGLTDWRIPPKNLSDRPLVVQQIMPELSGPIEMYENKACKSQDGTCDSKWILASDPKISTVVLKFDHFFELYKQESIALDPEVPRPAPSRESGRITRKFKLDLGRLSGRGLRAIVLSYSNDASDPVRNLGTMHFRNEKGEMEPVAWEETRTNIEGIRSGHDTLFDQVTQFLAGGVAHAFSGPAGQATSIGLFREGGQYDPVLGRSLQFQLGTPDLGAQADARKVLVDAGSNSFRFMTDSLKQKAEGPVSFSLFVDNLSQVLDEIEVRGNPGPASLQLEFALAFYKIGNYGKASQYFDRAGNETPSSPVLYYYRGIAYRQVGRYPDAIKSLERYLVYAPTARARAVTHTSLGITCRRNGEQSKAIQHFNEAIRIQPGYSSPYNSLAYLYAVQGQNLDKALALVNEALTLDPDIATYKDTKGWVLFRMGDARSALQLVEEASRRLPFDQEVAEHLAQIKKALALPAT